MQQTRQLRPLEERGKSAVTNPIPGSSCQRCWALPCHPCVLESASFQHSCSCSCMDSASCAARCLSGNSSVALCLKGGSFEGPYRSQPHRTVGCAADDSARFSPLTLLLSSLLLLRLSLLQVSIYYPSYHCVPHYFLYCFYSRLLTVPATIPLLLITPLVLLLFDPSLLIMFVINFSIYLLKSTSLQFGDKDVVWDHVRGLAQVQVKDIAQLPFVHQCHQPIIVGRYWVGSHVGLSGITRSFLT